MPRRPPSFKARPRAVVPKHGWTKRLTRQRRGYGRAHELMREQVLREEPLCRIHAQRGEVARTTIADHIVPKAEGGSDERENYQGLCDACSKAKTARESARARRRRTRRGG